MTINTEQWPIALETYGISMILIKRVRLYSLSCEFYLNLACIIHLYLYYTLLFYKVNLFSFSITSKINNLTKCCLSLHFLWILYFSLRLLQHSYIEPNPGTKWFSICHWNVNSLTAYWKVSQLQDFNLFMYIGNTSWFFNFKGWQCIVRWRILYNTRKSSQ